MKDNFFKTFGEIDEKYINEAANACCEESFAEEIKSTGLRKRIYTVVIKYTACAAVIGAAVFAVSSAAEFGKDDLTPNSTGVSDHDTEIFSAQTEAVIQDEAEVTTADFVIYTRCASPDDEIREKAREDWNNRTLTEPTDSELPEYYNNQFGGNSSMFIPAPEGSEVKAISDGEIVFVGYLEADDEHAINGNHVLVKHNDYVYTGYCGIDPEPSLQAGDTVEAGQVIGYADFDFDMQGYGFILEIRESNCINLDLTEMNSEDLNGIEANGETPVEFHNN